MRLDSLKQRITDHQIKIALERQRTTPNVSLIRQEKFSSGLSILGYLHCFEMGYKLGMLWPDRGVPDTLRGHQ